MVILNCAILHQTLFIPVEVFLVAPTAHCQTIQHKLFDELIDHRVEKTLLLAAICIIMNAGVLVVLMHYIPTGKVGGLLGVVDRRSDRHQRSFAEHRHAHGLATARHAAMRR